MTTVWLNSALVDSVAARIDPADRGFLLGDGVFETIAVRGGQILRLDAHGARLRQGCEVLSLPVPSVDLGAAIRATLAANALHDAAVRVTLTRGAGPRGVLPPPDTRPTLLITAAPLPPEPPPARCIVATVTRRNEQSPLARIKSLNYLDGILARQEARDRGADDAVLLNTAGTVAEATAANVFVVRAGRVFTPAVADGALPGIARAETLAAIEGIERQLTREDLICADELFLTSSLGVRPVVMLEGQPVGGDGAWPVTNKVKALIQSR